MLQYIVQVRHMHAANTQVNSTIKHISFYHVSYQSHLKICHQHKLATLFITLIKHLISQTRAFQGLVFGSPKWNLNGKTQGIFKEYSLRKFWITKVLTGLFNFCKFSCESLQSTMVGRLHNGGLIQKYNSPVHTT